MSALPEKFQIPGLPFWPVPCRALNRVAPAGALGRCQRFCFWSLPTYFQPNSGSSFSRASPFAARYSLIILLEPDGADGHERTCGPADCCCGSLEGQALMM